MFSLFCYFFPAANFVYYLPSRKLCTFTYTLAANGVVAICVSMIVPHGGQTTTIISPRNTSPSQQQGGGGGRGNSNRGVVPSHGMHHAAPAATAPPPSEDDVQALVAMGFPRSRALSSLAATNNQKDLAAALLLDD